MASTLVELEQRLIVLEQEMRDLRRLVVQADCAHQAEGEVSGLPTSWSAYWARVLQQLGIEGQPIGPEKVQAMIAAYWFKAEDNAFSLDIVAMREE
jgi:hypothetical protein